ncbi:MAG: alanine--tRNA ligase, partial [Aggregatilineales bacterium]
LVIRRAARFGKKLGFEDPFMAPIAQAVIDTMGGHYTDLIEQADFIKRTITQEEERFNRTMETGLNELESHLEKLSEGGILDGEIAFDLKATYGLPIQVTKDVAEERGYDVDMAGYETAEKRHSEISGGGQAMGEIDSGEFYQKLVEDTGIQVEYNPYDPAPVETEVLVLSQNGVRVKDVIVGDKVEVILAVTPFYVESGGQVSDTGTISGKNWTIEVESMKKPVTGIIVHVGEVVEGNPKEGDSATAQVDLSRRGDILRNHTGTHLLHAALRSNLGTHVQQRGSLVSPERLRFDFSHESKVTSEELAKIEQDINDAILTNYPVQSAEKSLEQAKSEGAMALFGEKYGDTVRTVIIDNGDNCYSYELCGGTHVNETAEIGAFVFTGEGSVSSGIRRIEALTGREAIHYIQGRVQLLNTLADKLGTTPNDAGNRIDALQEEVSTGKKQINELQRKLAKYTFDEMVGNLENINGKSALIAQLDGTPVDTMREMADWFRSKVKENGVLVLGSDIDGRPMLLISVTDDLVKQGVKAGNLIKPVAKIVGGGGGGRPNMAQAGGKDSSKLSQALDKARELLAE